MMLDKELQLASAQAITAAADTRVFTTNAIDLWGKSTTDDPRTPIQGLNALEIDPSQGHALYALFTITTTITTSGDSDNSIQFEIGDATAADGTGFASKASSPLIAQASAVAGLRVKIPLSAAAFTQRYLVGSVRPDTNDGAGAIDAGAISCEIVIDNVTL